jgi:hypothetical protein
LSDLTSQKSYFLPAEFDANWQVALRTRGACVGLAKFSSSSRNRLPQAFQK